MPYQPRYENQPENTFIFSVLAGAAQELLTVGPIIRKDVKRLLNYRGIDRQPDAPISSNLPSMASTDGSVYIRDWYSHQTDGVWEFSAKGLHRGLIDREGPNQILNFRYRSDENGNSGVSVGFYDTSIPTLEMASRVSDGNPRCIGALVSIGMDEKRADWLKPQVELMISSTGRSGPVDSKKIIRYDDSEFTLAMQPISSMQSGLTRFLGYNGHDIESASKMVAAITNPITPIYVNPSN